MKEQVNIITTQSTFQKGLTWRSMLALLYVLFVFQSAFAYLHLMTGSAPAESAIQWAAILLFVELSAVFAGTRLSLAEAIVIYLASGRAIRYSWFLAPPTGNLSHPGWIYQLYLRYSPISKALGIADKIPWFYAPVSSDIWIIRTFLHPEWTPVVIWTIVYFIVSICGNVVLNILTYNIYVVMEKLPFPLAYPIVDSVKTIVERDWRKMTVLGGATAVGMVYGLFLYILPLLFKVLRNVSMSIIPIPWIDWNTLIQGILPGASLGIATDIAIMALGFIIPFQVALGLLIGSIALYIVGNHLLVNYGLTGFSQEYTFGMSIATAWQRSMLWAWAMPIVGFSLAIGVIPLLLHPNVMIRAIKSLKALRETPIEISPWLLLILYLIPTLTLTIMDYWLAPDMPIPFYILLNVLWPFLLMIVTVRGQGLGIGIGIPYVREMTFKAIGYGGIDAWFVPIYLPAAWTTDLKVCDMTLTKHKDFILSLFIISPIGLLFGFLTLQSLWSLAPIPSSEYPGVLYSWPIEATMQSLFISPQAAEFFRIDRILYGFIAGSILYTIGEQLGFAPLIVGIAGGLSSAIPTAISTFIGAVIGIIVSRAVGSEWWRMYRGVIFAGILLGEGLIISVGTGLAVIARSMWSAPY